MVSISGDDAMCINEEQSGYIKRVKVIAGVVFLRI
jgi:hypothetical protein